jgi:hypothetical protein
MNPFRGVKEVGPGQYNNHQFTTFTNFNKHISKKGYVLGARTAQRQFYQFVVIDLINNEFIQKKKTISKIHVLNLLGSSPVSNSLPTRRKKDSKTIF